MWPWSQDFIDVSVKHLTDQSTIKKSVTPFSNYPTLHQTNTSMLFFARQPIFTVRGKLFGYELLYRDCSNLVTANIKDGSQATAEVIVDGIFFTLGHDQRNLKFFVNIPTELLSTGIIESVPPTMCVLEVLETVPCTEKNLAALRHLKSAGYKLALDDYIGQRDKKAFLDLVDIVKVDFRGTPAPQLEAVSGMLRRSGVTLLAEKVENSQEAEWAKQVGYNLLQGFYFQRPELVKGKMLAPDAHTRLRVLCWLTSNNPERKELLSLLSSSPQLALRLLNFVNSAAFAFRRKVDSIKQAVVLIGVDRLRRWLSALLVADQNHMSDIGKELYVRCIFRANFMRDVAVSVNYHYAEQLFTLGLFSTLDAMYKTSFEDLLEQTSLNDSVKKALISQESDFSPWLRATLCLEDGRLDEAACLFKALGAFDMQNIVKKYRANMSLALSLQSFVDTPLG